MASTETTDPALYGAFSVPQVIDQVWQYLSNQFSSGQIDEIILPTSFKSIIGQHGFDTIATRLRHLVQASVTMSEDPKAGVVRIFPARSPEGNTVLFEAPKPKNPIIKKAKVPRPPNAFILYRQHHHPLVKAKHPELHNNQISVILGTQWKNEDQTRRDHFKAMAEAVKKKHLRDHPEYSYQPRKPTERKRRMTRKKAAALSQLNRTLFTPTASASATTTVSPGKYSSSHGIRPVSEAITPHREEQLIKELPGVEKTASGNPMLVLGDEDLSEDHLRRMIQAHNDSLGYANEMAEESSSFSPAILFTERTGAGEHDVNFYSSMIDWNAMDRDIVAMDDVLQSSFNMAKPPSENTSLFQQARLFDSQSEWVTNAELARMSSAWD